MILRDSIIDSGLEELKVTNHLDAHACIFAIIQLYRTCVIHLSIHTEQ